MEVIWDDKLCEMICFSLVCCLPCVDAWIDLQGMRACLCKQGSLQGLPPAPPPYALFPCGCFVAWPARARCAW